MNLPLNLGRGFRLFIGLAIVAVGSLRAQDSNGALNQQQVDQLMGPIALYPDALVAIILPASTVPGDVVLAARYVANGGDPDKIDDQGWNESVKALAHYPTLLKWMDDNLTWTQQLGSAFLNQPDDLMASVQHLRAKARATGALTSTPQQKVVLDGDDIEIVPAQPDVIYVPYYDPDVVYVAQQPGYYYGGPYLTFGLGLPIGIWLDYDFNWHNRVILIGDRNHNWRENRDWNRRTWSGGNQKQGNWHTWTPPATRPVFARPDSRRPRPEIVRPNPIPGAPVYSRDSQRREQPSRPRPETNTRTPAGPQPDTTPRDAERSRTPVPAAVVPPQPNVRDNRDHNDRQPPGPPVPSRSEVSSTPIPTPRPTGRDGPPPPIPVRPENSNPPAPDRTVHDGPRPDRQPPQRPEPRQVSPPPRPVNQSPPPPVKDADSRGDKDHDVAR